jgi:hypothetical protein
MDNRSDDQQKSGAIHEDDSPTVDDLYEAYRCSKDEIIQKLRDCGTNIESY